MNLQTIEMPSYKAHELYRTYAKSVEAARVKRTEEARQWLTNIEQEDAALKAAYLALSRGKRVINIRAVVRSAGLTVDTKLPRIAIARADATDVRMRLRNDRHLEFVSTRDWRPAKGQIIDVGVQDAALWNERWRTEHKLRLAADVRALCPFIPPQFRPEQLKDYYLVWEPRWEPKPPDPDPFLVKRIGRDFFVIVAQWDMTPLEQSILEGRI